MREVLHGFRLKIKFIERRAGEKIDNIMSKPTLSQQALNELNQQIVKLAMQESMEALQEGVRFGEYVKAKA